MVAPVDGEVESRSVDVGDYVQVGTVAFDLIDLTNLRVTLPFPEYRAPEIRTGLPVRLTSVAAIGWRSCAHNLRSQRTRLLTRP